MFWHVFQIKGHPREGGIISVFHECNREGGLGWPWASCKPISKPSEVCSCPRLELKIASYTHYSEHSSQLEWLEEVAGIVWIMFFDFSSAFNTICCRETVKLQGRAHARGSLNYCCTVRQTKVCVAIRLCVVWSSVKENSLIPFPFTLNIKLLTMSTIICICCQRTASET